MFAIELREEFLNKTKKPQTQNKQKKVTVIADAAA